MNLVTGMAGGQEQSVPTVASLTRQLKQLRLSGAAEALAGIVDRGELTELTVLGELLDAEVRQRADRALERRLTDAGLPMSAALCDVDLFPGRGFAKADVTSWASANWVEKGRNMVLSGPTGSGKTWLACAITQAAALKGWTAKHWDVPELLTAWYETQERGGLPTLRKALLKADILVLDDWGVEPIDEGDLAVLRSAVIPRIKAKRSIVIASTANPTDWARWMGKSELGAALQRKLLAPSHLYGLSQRLSCRDAYCQLN